MTLCRPLLQARLGGVVKLAQALAEEARSARPETNAPLLKPMARWRSQQQRARRDGRRTIPGFPV